MSRLGRARTDAAGLTLIELVVAISVFAIVAGGIAATTGSGLNLIRNDRNRSIAANLASQEMDAIRQLPFSSLPLSGAPPPTTETVDGVPYTVQRQFDFVSTTATTSICDSAGGTPKLLRVTVTVFWANMGSLQNNPPKATTIITPPVGSFDPTKGHIAVKVLDRNAQPAMSVPVVVTGPGVNQTINTTAQGCAFFAFLNPNTYTVTLSAAGYVDRQGTVSPSQTAGVTSGSITSVGFDYDRAATITATLSPSGGGSLPASSWSQIPIALGNTAFLPTGTKLFAGAGTIRTLADLFPSSTGFTAWAGDCADADPEGVDGGGIAYWPGGLRSDPVSVTPGGASTATVATPSFVVNYNESGAPDGPDQVIAVHGSDNGCPTGETISLGTVDVNVATFTATLPYGRWTLQVVGHSPQSSWPTVVLDPTSGAVPTVTLGIL